MCDRYQKNIPAIFISFLYYYGYLIYIKLSFNVIFKLWETRFDGMVRNTFKPKLKKGQIWIYNDKEITNLNKHSFSQQLKNWIA